MGIKLEYKATKKKGDKKPDRRLSVAPVRVTRRAQKYENMYYLCKTTLFMDWLLLPFIIK